MQGLQIENYTLKKFLGKGSFGEVYLSTKKGSSKLYAIKRFDKAKIEPIKKNVINELSILKKLNHRNIIRFDDFKRTKNHYYIMFEYCNGGSLGDCLKKYQQKYFKNFNEEIVQYLMRQIVSAIQYLHNHRIIHRDLKLENILVNFNNESDKNSLNMLRTEVKIIDFDFARYLTKEQFAQTALGSPVNMDPAILNAVKNNAPVFEGYDESADIWSLGTLCYEMLIGKTPFNSPTVGGILQNVEKGSYSLPLNLSTEVVSFLNGMLQYDSYKRLSANELMRHHFLVKNVKDFKPLKLDGKANVKGGKVIMNSKDNNDKKNCWGDYNANDMMTLRNVPANLLMPQQKNANPANQVENYFTPYNFGFDQIPVINEEVNVNIGQNIASNNYGMVYNQVNNSPYEVGQMGNIQYGYNQVNNVPMGQVSQVSSMPLGYNNGVCGDIQGIINLSPTADLWG